MLNSIKTDRLLLRPVRLEDAIDYHALETDPEVKRFLGGPSTCSLQHYQTAITTGALGLATTLAVITPDTEKFIGRCGFTEYVENAEPIGWEINVVLHRAYWDNGYATEIGLALIPRGFELLHCERILGVVDAANLDSIRLCEKLQMKHVRDTMRYHRPARVYAVARDL